MKRCTAFPDFEDLDIEEDSEGSQAGRGGGSKNFGNPYNKRQQWKTCGPEFHGCNYSNQKPTRCIDF